MVISNTLHMKLTRQRAGAFVRRQRADFRFDIMLFSPLTELFYSLPCRPCMCEMCGYIRGSLVSQQIRRMRSGSTSLC